MKRADFAPTTSHLFVCVNRRSPTDPLGAGCGDRGDALYRELKSCVARGGLATRVWVTRTHCLGVCPKQGAAVATMPPYRLFTGATPEDAAELLA